MCRQNIIILFFAMLFFINLLIGAPVQFMPVELQQPDGTKLNLFASGDEFYNWLHDKDGYTIKQNDKGWYVYLDKKSKDELIFTDLVVGRDNPSSRSLSPWTNISPEKMGEIRKNMLREMRPDNIRNAPTRGTINNIVIFIRFADQQEFSQDSINILKNMFNTNATTDNTMQDYFWETSYQKLNVSSTFYPNYPPTVYSWQDSNPRGYYCPYSDIDTIGYTTDAWTRLRDLQVNAINGISSQIDPNLNIDGDNDGQVDNVCFVIKGATTAWASILWPHKSTLYYHNMYINGKRVSDYNVQISDHLDIHGNGVLCHEMFHTLGAPDLYDYNPFDDSIVGAWDIMSCNLNPPQHMNAYMKYKYGGWIDSLQVISTPGTYYLKPLTDSLGQCFRINSPTRPNEFFVVEFRSETSTFEHGVYHFPNSNGMIIYRINTNCTGNASGPPYEVYVYRPQGVISFAAYNSQSGKTHFDNNTYIWHYYTDFTMPRCFLSDDLDGNISISDIGSSLGDSISFHLDFLPPQKFTAICTHNSVTLNWQNCSSFTPSMYKIYKNGTLLTETSDTTYIDTDVTVGNNLSYYITAVYTNPSGESGASVTINVTPTLSPPQNLTAYGFHRSVVLNWQINYPYTPTSYSIYKDGIFLTNTSNMTFTDTAVTNRDQYRYYVKANYSNPTSISAASNTVYITPLPLPPCSLIVITNDSHCELTWLVPEAGYPSSYKIYRNETYLATTSNLTYTDFAVNVGEQYSYYVTAVYTDPSDESAASNTIDIIPVSYVWVEISYTPDSYQLPWVENLQYSYSQTIYSQAEINIPNRKISKLFLHWKGGEFVGENDVANIQGINLDIYMGHTDRTYFSNQYSLIPLNYLTQVYSGIITLTSEEEWIEIDLDTPFIYINTQNLVIAVDKNTCGNNYVNFSTSSIGSEQKSILVAKDSDIDPASQDFSDAPVLDALTCILDVRLNFTAINNPKITISNSSLEFGDVAIGSSKSDTLTINNSGNINLIGTISVPEDFNISPSANFNIPPGQNVDFIITFTPTEVQNYSTNLTVTSNDEDDGTIFVPLTGVVSVPPPPQYLTAVCTSNSVTLNWHVLGPIPSGYNIYRNDSLYVSVSDTTYTDTNVVYHTEYSYYVTSVVSDSINLIESTASNVVNIIIRYEEIISIGNGESLDCEIPFRLSGGHYSYSQSIYLQSEIYQPSLKIDMLSWHWSGEVDYADSISIYMGHTSQDAFAGRNIWVPFSNLTQVYNGEITATSSDEWIELVLDTPFYYNNIENLVIAVNKHTNLEYQGRFYTTPLNDERSIIFVDDQSNIDPANLPDNVEILTNIPNIKLFLMELQPPVIAVSSTNLEFEDVSLGLSNQITLNIQNYGETNLIGSITAPEGFSVISSSRSENRNLISYDIPRGKNTDFLITFTPTSVQDYITNLTITSNDPDHESILIPLSGSGYTPPHLMLSTTTLTENLFMGDCVADTLILSNTGSRTLTYTISINEPSRQGRTILSGSKISSPLRDVPWLTCASLSGTIEGGDSIPLVFTFISENATLCENQAIITVTSNDPADSIQAIDVTLNVSPSPLPPRNLTGFSNDSTCILTWLVPEIGNPSSYNIYRDLIYLANTSDTTYTDIDSTLIAGNSYSYYVTSVYTNPDGESVASNSVNITFIDGLELTIGDGAAGGCEIPLRLSGEHYSYSQSIYLQSEINQSNHLIDRLYWHWYGSTEYRDSISIYMGHTSQDTFASQNSWVSLSNLTQVYNGEITSHYSDEWIELVLDAPFYYNNTQNLVIAANKKSNISADESGFYTTQLITNRSIIIVDHESYIDPANPLANNMESELYPFIPDIKLFLLNESGYTPPHLVLSSTNLGENLNMSDCSADTLTLSNTGSRVLTYSISVSEPTRITGWNSPDSRPSSSVRDVSWLSFSSESGSIERYQSIPISINYDSENAQLGVNQATISITTNDPEQSIYTVDVTLTVGLKPPMIEIHRDTNYPIHPQITWEDVPGANSYLIYTRVDPNADYVYLTHTDYHYYNCSFDYDQQYFRVIAYTDQYNVSSLPSEPVGYIKKIVGYGSYEPFSYPFYSSNMSIENLLGDQFGNGDSVQDANTGWNSTYYTGYGWFPSDTSFVALSPGGAYWAVLDPSNPALDYYLLGKVDPQVVSVNIQGNDGWTAFSLNEAENIAISSFSNPNIVDMDSIVDASTGENALYLSGLGWLGSLEYFEPGHVYWYNSQASENYTWIYNPNARQIYTLPPTKVNRPNEDKVRIKKKKK